MSDAFPEALQKHLSGDLAGAELLYGQILAAVPDHFDARHNLAYLRQQQGRHEEAVALFEQAIAVRATPFALTNLALSLIALRRLDEGGAACQRALALDPHLFAAHCNLSWALALRQPEEAIASADRAIALDPAQAAPYANKAMAMANLNRLAESIAAYEEAERRDPYNPAIQRDFALVLLRAGDFSRGFEKFRHRFAAEPSAQNLMDDFAGAIFTGTEPLAGRSILVLTEQGQGDAIQFGRYLPMLVERGARVTFLVQQPLVSLFRFSMPSLAAVAHELPRGSRFDFKTRLLSLPRVFGTTLASIPDRVPYLAAEPTRIAAWRARRPAKSCLRAGLVWAGSAAHTNDAQRSIPLQALAPLLDLDGVSFVSLQTEMRPGDAELLHAHPRIEDVAADLRDYADTAAALASLDLVVSVDTSVAHLAGALAMPVFVMLPFASDWRWLSARDDSPWYPTARLFRQPRMADWPSVVAAVRAAIVPLAAEETASAR